jgi:hypothetical protein
MVRLLLAVCLLAAASRPALADEEVPGARVLPSLSLAIGIEGEEAFFHSWLGVSVQPRPGRSPFFFAAGTDLEIRQITEQMGQTASVLVLRPTVRAGFGAYGDGHKLPFMTVYSLVGLKLGHLTGPPSVIVGAGFSMPGLIPVFARAGLPTMIEAVVDLRETSAALRVGWNI